jgi:hypothetical protein
MADVDRADIASIETAALHAITIVTAVIQNQRSSFLLSPMLTKQQGISSHSAEPNFHTGDNFAHGGFSAWVDDPRLEAPRFSHKQLAFAAR